MDERKENIKRIKNAVLLGSSVQLKISVYNEARLFYFKGCILEYDPKKQKLWFWDIFDGIKSFPIMDIRNIKIIEESAFTPSQINAWRSKILTRK